MTQQENDELMYASPEDIAFYHKCVEGLPTLAGLNGTGNDDSGMPIPYGCGPHSLRCLREVVEFVRPKKMFEIGFNCGYSSAMWLNLSSRLKLWSCDISNKKETLVAAEILERRFPKRFHYFNREEDDSITKVKDIDLVFIDGGHLYEDVKWDIELSLLMGIQYLAFDDILDQFGPGVRPAIKEYPQLQLVKEMGNIALYKNTSV